MEIYKYGPIGTHMIPTSLRMKRGAQLVRIHEQYGDYIFIWAYVDPGADEVLRNFVLVGTGQPVVWPGAEYVDTVWNGEFVWHLFDLGEE